MAPTCIVTGKPIDHDKIGSRAAVVKTACAAVSTNLGVVSRAGLSRYDEVIRQAHQVAEERGLRPSFGGIIPHKQLRRIALKLLREQQ